MREPFKHQLEGIEFLKKNKRAILADQPGLGKTLQAITAAGTTSSGAILVICPASLKINWEREIHMVYPEDNVIIISGGAATDHISKAAWIIINYDILSKHLPMLKEMVKNGEIETIIGDEAHYCKDTKTLRTKAFLSLTEHAQQVYCLTGTPVMNRPIEIFALLKAVKHPLAHSQDKTASALRKEFGKRYCAAYFHQFGRSGRGFWDETGSSRLPELRALTKDIFLRRTKTEVLDLPEKIVSVVPTTLSTEYQRAYDTAWDNYLEWVANHPEGKDLKNIMSAQALVELGKLKQVCSLAKISRIVTDVENFIEQGEKVIIFSQYTETIKTLAQQLRKEGSVTLTGADDMDMRQAAMDAFQNDENCKVFIANMKAGGVGITLTAGSIVIFADMEWSPEIHRQAEDRAHRIGQTGTVNVYYYIAESTIEEDIIDTLMNKQETIGVLTGGETVIQAFMDRLIQKTK